MVEVYRARDSTLRREVAIKVLPEAVGCDTERLARFQREAEVLASLNHPNIAHIHGLERSGAVRAIVMELVEGPTLADLIRRQGAMPAADALSIGAQIADALDAAHTGGVVHRDLKPANIKVRDDGVVKVLDFGLAKVEPAKGRDDVSNSPTITSEHTRAGVVLGTAAYMSPEQARGRLVDRRTDIWSFGCVLYEMLTGRRAFGGETVSDTMAAILSREPDWTALPLELPDSLRRLLRRCLTKDPRQRLRDIGDARLEIAEGMSASTARTGSRGGGIGAGWWVAAALVVALGVAL
jgi:serine/threonine protein kinase